MDDKDTDLDIMEDVEHDDTPPEAFYLALRQALKQLELNQTPSNVQL